MLNIKQTEYTVCKVLFGYGVNEKKIKIHKYESKHSNFDREMVYQ